MYKGQPYNCIHVICTKVLEQTKTRVLFTIKQKNNLPLTTLQTDKKNETDDKEMANLFNGYFISIAWKFNRKIAKAKNLHLSYLGSMKENNKCYV